MTDRILLSQSRLGLGAAAIFTAVFCANAQDNSAATSEFVIEEITVTARKREENLQDTPISIAAFSARDLSLRQIESADELDHITPNLQFTTQSPSAGNNSSSQIFIRGIGQTEFLPSTDPGVGLYIDGVYNARSVAALDFIDIERVEVLRGPQGTLFGRNTIGGAISIQSRKPLDQLTGSVELKIGEDNRQDLQAEINVPIGATLLSKFSLGKRKRDGYVTRLSDGLDLGDDDSIGARAYLMWTPSEAIEVDLILDHVDEDENGAPQVFNSIASNQLFARVSSARSGCPAPGTELDDPRCVNNQYNEGFFATNSTFPLASSLRSSGASMTVDWYAGGLNIKSITGYRDTEWFASRDADNTPFAILHTQNDDRAEQFSQEIQFSGEAQDGRLNWLLGLYHFEEQANDDYFVEITFGQFKTGGQVDNDTQAIFGQATYAISERLSLTAGLRSSEETKRFTPEQGAITNYTFPTASGPQTIPPGTPFFTDNSERRKEVSESTPMLNLAYAWSDDLMTYVSYSEGFKSGGFNARNIKPLPDVPEFDPEFAETIEFGFKSTFWNRRARLNGAIFSTDYTDLQFVIREDFAPITFNAGEASIDGFELEWDFIPLEGLLISGGVGYIDAEYEQLSAELIANGGVAIDNELPHTPEWSGNLGIGYTFELPRQWAMSPRLDASYRSKIYFNANNTEAIAQDGYSVYNALVSFDNPNFDWDIVFGIKNLTDEKYKLAGNSSLEASASYAESTYARPRHWLLSARYHF